MLAHALRRWSEGERHASALLAIDSSDQRGWALRLEEGRLRGDTLSMQRNAAHLARLPRTQRNVWLAMAYARGPYGTRLLSMTPEQLGLTTLSDSVQDYYDTKADIRIAQGDEGRARAYYDSIRTKLSRRTLSGPRLYALAGYLALAQSATGDTAAGRRTLTSLVASARQVATRSDLRDVLEPRVMAAIYGRLGEPEEAVPWLEAGLRAPVRWTARGYANEPKTKVLRGSPAFERFLRAHPE